MSEEKIQVPDIGDEEDVEVIEVLVSPGDEVSENDSLIVLESDKAAMEIPAPKGGVIKKVLVKVGDKVSKGDDIASIDATAESGSNDNKDSADADEKDSGKEESSEKDSGKEESSEKDSSNEESSEKDSGKEESSEKDPGKEESSAATSGKAEKADKPAAKSSPAKKTVQEVNVPDLGEDGDVEVIEILVAEGDEIKKEDGLITLESDKAAMDVPSPAEGVVKKIRVKVGDKVSEGSVILDLESTDGSGAEKTGGKTEQTASKKDADKQQGTDGDKQEQKAPAAQKQDSKPGGGAGAEVYAGPAVRKMARELGVDLSRVSGSGSRGRIVKEDVDAFVKGIMESGGAGAAAGLPAMEDIDFSQFGEVEEVEMSKLHRVTARNMSRNWLNVPHVTQFDEADITDLEDFRQQQKALAEKKGIKLTPLPFIVKACARVLSEHPRFNVSLHSSGSKLIQKKYIHIGVAVATPAGLMVPVVKNADHKSIWEIAAEIAELSEKAKDRKLTKVDMQGSCFTISSLGNLGGTGFTPIVNAPEVAILGVSRMTVKPVYKDGEFVPRKMLPFALSYDHRAVNGVDGGMFCSTLAELLGDIRLLAL